MCPCMHAYMHAGTHVFIYPSVRLYVCLFVCLSVCLSVCIYVCVSDKLEQSAHAVKMSDYIGTNILEVFECPESVADRSNCFGRVLGGINRAKQGKNWIGT